MVGRWGFEAEGRHRELGASFYTKPRRLFATLVSMHRARASKSATSAHRRFRVGTRGARDARMRGSPERHTTDRRLARSRKWNPGPGARPAARTARSRASIDGGPRHGLRVWRVQCAGKMSAATGAGREMVAPAVRGDSARVGRQNTPKFASERRVLLQKRDTAAAPCAWAARRSAHGAPWQSDERSGEEAARFGTQRAQGEPHRTAQSAQASV